jgi:hypothetical protein
MRGRTGILIGAAAALTAAAGAALADGPPTPQIPPAVLAATRMIAEGRETFRHDNFGNEDFWGGQLGLHLKIAGAANGGVGDGLSPEAALALGLKVDSQQLTKEVVRGIRSGAIELDNPAVTLKLIQLDAVVGVRGFFDGNGRMTSIGITCALCHSDVDDSFAPGIGRRLDGWPARDLDVGKVIGFSNSLAPFATLLGVSEGDVKKVLDSWGPGRFDAQLILDGKTARPDGKTAAVLLPPAYGLAGVNLHTYTGWGSVPYWNALVAVLEMQGKGTLFDPRLNDAAKFPIAAKNGFGDVRRTPDEVTPKLAALHFYQLSLPAPKPPKGSFNWTAAQRGKRLFAADGKAHCATCHVPPLFTEPGWNLHTPEEIGIDAFQADRSPEGKYRTTPLKGVWSRGKGGYYHDGRFATLGDVVTHYNAHLSLGLSDGERRDLVEYLKSL